MNDHERSAVDDDRKQILDYMKTHHLEEVSIGVRSIEEGREGGRERAAERG
jgi:hypothetical protein